MTRLKKFFFVIVAFFLLLASTDILLGYLLWIRDKSTSSVLYISKMCYLRLKGIPQGSVVAYCDPHPINVPDKYLGTSDTPGSYTITFKDVITGKFHSYYVTIDERGHRVTSYDSRPFLGKRGIWIFGDSFVFGNGNNDETTCPFFLQQFFSDFHVVNFAHGGYGNVHAYLQIKREFENNSVFPAIIVIFYGKYFNDRNVAAPNWIRNCWFDKREAAGNESEYFYPKASIKNAELAVEYVALFQKNDLPGDSEPHEQYKIEVTQRILQEIYYMGEKNRVNMILAFTVGDDSDQVVSYAQQIGYTICDLRPRSDRNEWDDFRPFDYHPGPLSQDNYARKLSKTISITLGNP